MLTPSKGCVMNLNSKPLFIRTRIEDAPMDIAQINKLSREIEENLLTANYLLKNPTKLPNAVELAESHRHSAKYCQKIRDRALAMRN
jgi:hypothetical protein